MEFTVGNDTRLETAPEPIRNVWRGQWIFMNNSFNEDERSFLELFGVRFSMLIPYVNRIDYWIPQAYSTEESDE